MANVVSAVATLVKMADNIRALERTVLQLMYHPDSTPEQLWQAHEALVRLRVNYSEAYTKVEPLTRGIHGLRIRMASCRMYNL